MGKAKSKGSTGSVTRTELLYRLRIVEQALVDGKRGAEILAVLAASGRKVSPGTLTRYIRMVRDKWGEEDALMRPIWRERQLRKLHDVAFKLEQSEAWSQWIQAQRLIADIEGNLAPTQVDHHLSVDPFDEWKLDELERYVQSQGRVIPARFADGSETTPALGEVEPGESETVH